MAVDPNIKKKADDIRNKVYGKEVRESLASGLEAMSSDVVDTVSRQSNVESQFQDVIDNTTGKDVISAPEIIAARNGESNLKARLDKEKNEVTAQLAQTEASKVDKAGSGQVTYANLAQDAREQITGGNTAVVGVDAVIEENIANRAVTMNKLGFPSVHSVGISWGKDDVTIDESTKTVTFGIQTIINVRLSDNTVVQSKPVPSATSFTFDGPQSLIINVDSREVSLVDSTAITNRDVVLLTHHATLGFYDGILYHSSGRTENLSEIGLLYSPSKVPNFDFNKNELTIPQPARLVHKNNMHILDDGENDVVVDLAPLTYTMYGVLLYDLDLEQFIVREYGTMSDKKEKEILLAVYHRGNKVVYMPGAHTIDGKMPNYAINEEAPINSVSKAPYIWGDFSNTHISEPMVTMDDVLIDYTLDEIYGEYDELVANNSDIFTKNLLGYGSDANGNEDTNLPIYEYVLTPRNESVITADGVKPFTKSPTILIQTATHGNEKGTVWATLDFFKELLSGNSEELNDLSQNFAFKIIPLVNPGGFNDNTRNNRNGVNINRNYPYNWDSLSGADKGTAPLSESETIISANWLEENKDAVMYIDYHNSIGGASSYIITESDKVKGVYSSLIRRLSVEWSKTLYPGRPKNSVFGAIIDAWAGGFSILHGYHNTGIELSFTIESGTSFNNVDYNSEALTKSKELLSNSILAVADYVKRQ